ncbi:MAG: hypothetical protein P4L26_15425, partial [Terracidiphilus sp.]|nr:hypothetical protein [Terracidiphilus sp.]
MQKGQAMIDNRQRRGWILIAAIAIGFALLCLLVPQGHAGSAADYAAILPLLFAGLISPLSLFAPLALAYAGRVPQAPVLHPSFQRPPPLR